jgi:hypothetical protein
MRIIIRAKIGAVDWNAVFDHAEESSVSCRKRLRQVGISPEVLHVVACRTRFS